MEIDTIIIHIILPFTNNSKHDNNSKDNKTAL